MSSDQSMQAVYLVGVLVLIASSFFVRRIPIGQTMKMFASWILIFAAVFMIIALKDDLIAAGKRVIGAGGNEATAKAGEAMRIRLAEDGHYWVNGSINGVQARFLVDSGATVTSLSEGIADKAKIERGSLPVIVETANGSTTVSRGTAKTVQVGPIQRSDMAVHISKGFGETNVIGMNFLASLKGWGVENGDLVLKE